MTVSEEEDGGVDLGVLTMLDIATKNDDCEVDVEVEITAMLSVLELEELISESSLLSDATVETDVEKAELNILKPVEEDDGESEEDELELLLLEDEDEEDDEEDDEEEGAQSLSLEH